MLEPFDQATVAALREASRIINSLEASNARIQSLLEANTAEVERRRAVEEQLALAKADVQVWHERYHEARARLERADEMETERYDR